MPEATTPCCIFCSQPATEMVEPPRRTLARGVDPKDPSYSVTVILPDVPLCTPHILEVRQGNRLIGWCDDESCQAYGELGEISTCGDPYQKLGSSSRS